MIFAQTVRDMRERKKLTQAEVAESMNLARASYIAIEQGKRDVSFQEAEKLGQILGVTVEELTHHAAPDYEKYKEMLVSFLNFTGGDGKVPKTKLAKLLYLADFAWFYEHLESMSGMAYRKIAYGPVPDQFFRAIDELEEQGVIDIDRKQYEGGEMSLISITRAGQRYGEQKVSHEELKLMKKIEKKWRGKKTKDIVAFTHSQLPYALAFPNDIISYAVITQEDAEYVY